MVTRQQLTRLAGQIDALADAIDPDAAPVTITVFAGETPEFAARRHCELRPEHAGRRVRFDYQPHHHRSDPGHEWGTVWGATEEERGALVEGLKRFMKKNEGTPCNFVGLFDPPPAAPQTSEEEASKRCGSIPTAT